MNSRLASAERPVRGHPFITFAKFLGFWNPPPLVCNQGWSTVLNSRNLPYCIRFWVPSPLCKRNKWIAPYPKSNFPTVLMDQVLVQVQYWTLNIAQLSKWKKIITAGLGYIKNTSQKKFWVTHALLPNEPYPLYRNWRNPPHPRPVNIGTQILRAVLQDDPSEW